MTSLLHSKDKLARSIALVVLLTAVAAPGCMPLTSEGFERACREDMIAFAAVEDSYHAQNGVYATFSELVRSGDVDSEKTLATMTAAYTWDLFLNEDQSAFRVVATASQDPALRTYMVDPARAVMRLTEVPVDDPGRVWKAFMNAEDLSWAENRRYVFPEIPEYRDLALRLNLQISEDGQSYTLTNPHDVAPDQPIADLGPEFIYVSTAEKFFRMEPAR